MSSARKLPCPARQTFQTYLTENGVDTEFKRVVDKLKEELPLPEDPWKFIGTIFDSANKKELTLAVKEKVKVVQGENKEILLKIEKNEQKIFELERKIEVELKRLGLVD